MLKGQFNLEDFADQLKQLRKMGPLSQVMDMLPGGIGTGCTKCFTRRNREEA